MASSGGYKIRPWPSRTDSRDIFRIYLSPSNLVLHKFSAGDICNIETADGLIKPAVVWPAAEKIKEDIVQTSKALQKLYGLELGCKVLLSKTKDPPQDANNVGLSEVFEDDSDVSLSPLDEGGRFHWSWLLEYTVEQAVMLSPGMMLDNCEYKGEKRAFKVQEVNFSAESLLYRAHKGCKVYIVDNTKEAAHPGDNLKCELLISSDGVGGLDRQIKQLNDIVAMYSPSYDSTYNVPAFFQPRQGGILLHGARGTGKSTLIRKVSEAGWQKVFHIDHATTTLRAEDSEAVIARIFSDALRYQPSVIIMDTLDSIANKQESPSLGRAFCIGQVLSRQLERLGNTRTLAIGSCRSLTDIYQDLRGVGRFELEVEIPIPDSRSRTEILKVLSGLPKDSVQSTLNDIGTRTHGFVGADLRKLLGQAVKTRAIRNRGAGLDQRGIENVPPDVLLDDMKADFDCALLRVRPTAMQEVFVETPNIRWSDIGGQHGVKEELEEAVIWPIKYPEAMERHGLRPKKGLLLYGPPGCSKTMTAKAAATESGLNFLTVRGPELMSMYVGESERAIREVFSKARAVSPSIIFFDEIDAIGATGDNGQHGGVHTVTTLLTELDGFQELNDVFVLAATNKPERLDPALIRAGRLDTTLYVGLPDTTARREILVMRMRNMYLSDGLDVVALSEATEGFSGAEIINICQKASYVALREEMDIKEHQRVSQEHFRIALTRVEKSITPEMIRTYEAWGAGRH